MQGTCNIVAFEMPALKMGSWSVTTRRQLKTLVRQDELEELVPYDFTTEQG